VIDQESSRVGKYHSSKPRASVCKSLKTPSQPILKRRDGEMSLLVQDSASGQTNAPAAAVKERVSGGANRE
jgi:hypothetical protein